jgi:hypothetical protein
VALHELLRGEGIHTPGTAKRFQRQLARIAANPWVLATSVDRRYRTVTGGAPSWMAKRMHWYFSHVLKLGTRDQVVRKRFLEVQGMLRGRNAILAPSVAVRVLKSALFPNSAPPLCVGLSSATKNKPNDEG